MPDALSLSPVHWNYLRPLRRNRLHSPPKTVNIWNPNVISIFGICNFDLLLSMPTFFSDPVLRAGACDFSESDSSAWFCIDDTSIFSSAVVANDSSPLFDTLVLVLSQFDVAVAFSSCATTTSNGAVVVVSVEVNGSCGCGGCSCCTGAADDDDWVRLVDTLVDGCGCVLVAVNIACFDGPFLSFTFLPAKTKRKFNDKLMMHIVRKSWRIPTIYLYSNSYCTQLDPLRACWSERHQSPRLRWTKSPPLPPFAVGRGGSACSGSSVYCNMGDFIKLVSLVHQIFIIAYLSRILSRSFSISWCCSYRAFKCLKVCTYSISSKILLKFSTTYEHSVLISSALINSKSSSMADSSKLYRPLFLMNASTTGANKFPLTICLLCEEINWQWLVLSVS